MIRAFDGIDFYLQFYDTQNTLGLELLSDYYQRDLRDHTLHCLLTSRLYQKTFCFQKGRKGGKRLQVFKNSLCFDKTTFFAFHLSFVSELLKGESLNAQRKGKDVS